MQTTVCPVNTRMSDIQMPLFYKISTSSISTVQTLKKCRLCQSQAEFSCLHAFSALALQFVQHHLLGVANTKQSNRGISKPSFAIPYVLNIIEQLEDRARSFVGVVPM